MFQTCNSNLKSRFTIPTVFDQISKTSSFHILEEVEGLIERGEEIYGTASRKERRRGSNNLEAIAGIKRVTRSRPIGFDFQFSFVKSTVRERDERAVFTREEREA